MKQPFVRAVSGEIPMRAMRDLLIDTAFTLPASLPRRAHPRRQLAKSRCQEATVKRRRKCQARAFACIL
jgi:hypothetical protein